MVKAKKADKFFYSAKLEGYRARSVYKLIEINKKFNILRDNIKVADLGSTRKLEPNVSKVFIQKK